MVARASVTTIITTVLITLITFVVILTMGGDRTTNIIEGVVLFIGLIIFAGALVRGSELKLTRKTEKSLNR